MPLPINYLVYGTVTQESGSPVPLGTTVSATGAAGTVNTTTDANGYYQVDIQNACNSDGETVTISCTYGVESDSDSFTLDLATIAKNIDLSLSATLPAGAQATFAVYVGSDLVPNVYSVTYEDPSIILTDIPEFEVETDNITGRNINKFSVGQTVNIYRYGSLVFVGVVEPRKFSKSASAGSTMKFGGPHKGYHMLQNRVCDYYRASNNSYAPVVNPWRFGRKTSATDNTLIDGLRPDDIMKCLIGTEFIWQEWFDNHDFVEFKGESVYTSHTTGDTGQIGGIDGNNYEAQTFQVATAVDVTKFSIKIAHLVDPAEGNFVCCIYNTTSNHPNTSLGASSVAADTVGLIANPEWVDFVFDPPVSISASTLYAIVLKYPDASGVGVGDSGLWRRDPLFGYSSGQRWRTTDGGSNWTSYPLYDFMFEVYGQDQTTTLVVADGALKLPKTATVTDDADSYATTGTIDSVGLYNGDKYVDEMGEIASVALKLIGTKFSTYDPSVYVCRDKDEASPTWHLVSTTFDGDSVWEGNYNFTDSPTYKNQFGYRISMTGSGAGTSEVEYARFDCVTASDTSVTAGTITEYDDPNMTDDTIAINLAGLTRLEALEKVRRLTNTSTVYAESNWDAYINTGLQYDFQVVRGSDKDDVFSFDNTNLTLLDQKFDGNIKNALIAQGQGEVPYAVTLTGSDMQDATSIATYGKKTGYFIDKSIPDAPTLYKRAKAYLKYMKDPRENLDVKICNDPALDWDVGDRITVQDTDLDIDDYFRVLSRKVTFKQDADEQVNIELGTKSDTVGGFFRNIQDHFSSQDVITQGTGSPTNTLAAGLVYDSSYAAEYPFYIPPGAQRVMISVKTHKFRAYSKAALTSESAHTHGLSGVTAASGGSHSHAVTGDTSTSTAPSVSGDSGYDPDQSAVVTSDQAELWSTGRVSSTWYTIVTHSVGAVHTGGYVGWFHLDSLPDRVTEVRARIKVGATYYPFVNGIGRGNPSRDTGQDAGNCDLCVPTFADMYNKSVELQIRATTSDALPYNVMQRVQGVGYARHRHDDGSYAAASHTHAVSGQTASSAGSHTHTLSGTATDPGSAHSHSPEFGIYEFGYYPAKTCMRIDSSNNAIVQKFGFIGTEDAATEIIDLDITDDLRNADGALAEGRRVLYFAPQTSSNNADGLGIISVSHKIIVTTASDEVDLSPLPT